MSALEDISLRQRLFLISQGIFHLLLAIFITSTVWIMAYNRDWNLLNTWHVFLSTIGFALLMAEAVAVLNPGNEFLIGCSRKSRRIIHGVIMSLATAAVIAGVSIKIQDKNNNNNRSHFTTNHGILGFVAFILTICTFFGGFVVYYSKEIYEYLGIKPVLIKSIHLCLGIAAYVIGIVTLCYGIHDYLYEVSYETSICFIVILSIYVCLSLIGPFVSLFRI